MKQFSTVLSKEIFRGLRSDYRVGRNSAGLVDLFNAETSEEGLATFDPIVNPIDIGDISAYGLDIDWPYPQIFRGWDQTIIAAKTSLVVVDERDWSVGPVSIYDARNIDTEAVPALGEPWQFIDMHKAWMLCNGTSTVFLPGNNELFGHERKVLSQSSIGIRAGCYFKGRVLLGGFTPDEFWHDYWKAFWLDWSSRRDLGIVPPLEIGENSVWWSTIGGGDVFSLIYPELGITGFLNDEDVNSAERPIIFDLLQRNECGMMPILKGAIRMLKPLGDGVIVYSDSGVALLSPATDPVPTFGMRVLSSMGIANGIAVAGDDRSGHAFIDQAGTLWMIAPDFSITKLGYREFFYQMLGNEIMASYSAEDGGKWIFSDGVRTFLYKRSGLSEIDQMITSCDFVAGATVGMCDEAGSRDSSFVLVSGDLDLGIRGIKHVHSVELSTNSTTNLWISIFYKYNKAEETWKQTAWRKVNKEGWAVTSCSCVDFRIAVKGDNYAEVEPPDYITVKWSTVDKRDIRGLYDNKSSE